MNKNECINCDARHKMLKCGMGHKFIDKMLKFIDEDIGSKDLMKLWLYEDNPKARSEVWLELLKEMDS